MSSTEVTSASDHSILADEVRRFSAPAGYDILRVVLGLVLLVASTFKGYELATEPIVGKGIFSSRWLLIGLVELEIFFGLWLISGLHPVWTRRSTILIFTAFACVSLYKGLTGAESCGCFGKATISPWWTFCFDLVVVGLLSRYSPYSDRPASSLSFRQLSVSIVAVLTIWLLIGVPGVIAMSTTKIAKLNEDGFFVGESNLIVLEPEKWVGKQFPLLPYVSNISNQLKQDSWIVVLFHHDCPKCQKVLSQYSLRGNERIASQNKGIAFVELPPYGKSDALIGSRVSYGRLDGSMKWFVATPLEIVLNQGDVLDVRVL